ncbi:MAG TPA: hypothetical protein VM818_16075 [Vicinamibacterales bacterium]|nr:hypothetical protein [Vicinamibacterales bacterium]
MRYRQSRVLMIVATLVAAPAAAQNSTQPLNPGQSLSTAKPAAPPPSKPAPRSADGKIVLGTVPGEQGIWVGDGRLVINPRSYEPNTTKNAPIHIDNTPLQDWARELVNARHGEFLKDEPHARCKPSGGPREFITPYGFELLELPELKQVFIFDIGGPHSYRVIYMDGRGHPKNLEPSYYGHSTGRWEGDTLVVDAVGFNEKFWMSRDGLPHTDQLHLTERITRLDYNTLKYEVTIDDPGAYTQPWTSSFNLRWTPGQEVFEYQCQGNNFFPDSVFGSNYFDETTSVVP